MGVAALHTTSAAGDGEAITTLEGPRLVTAGANRGAPHISEPAALKGAPRCTSVRKALRFYTARYLHWLRLRAGGAERPLARGVGCPRYLVFVRKQQAAIARKAYYLWLSTRTLRNFPFCDGCNAWYRAVEEVQKVFPGTSSWLWSCSAAEGGHGRWVGYGGQPYSTRLRDSDTVGGPLQFRYSTFKGMFRHGAEYAQTRGWRVPLWDYTQAWRSALGQALAGGWARYTGNDAHHWYASFGNGC